MGQALYRKYRSRSLKEVIGQEHITDTLARALKAGRISHAYLFTGPRGVGKTSIARILAHEINELPYADTPQLDIIEIDAASNRRIDDIRDLREKVHIAPVSAKYKVYIIDEVHMLTGESFNALLKTLEEPPAHVVFILATTEAHKLPATIVSRTQRFSFRPIAKEKVVAHLRAIADKEDVDITDDALLLIADHGEGSFRDSISLLDQLRHVSSKTITAEDVARTLGLAPQAALKKLVDAITKGDQTLAAKTLAELEANGSAIAALVHQLNQALAAQAPTNSRLYHLIDQLVDVPRAYNPSLKLLSTIMVFMDDQPKAKPPKKDDEVKHVATQVSKPVVNISQKPATPPKAKTAEPAKKEEIQPPAPTEGVPFDGLSAKQWGEVLAAVKKASPPLYGVLKQAQPVFDADAQQLTLKFKYQLHSKKLDDAKQKALLAGTIHATLGSTLMIQTEIDKTATPPVISDDPAVTSVAAIMGGGEVINGEAV
ncbi:MAG: DNA polymerase III subunit gamma/tau [Candidatus Saccharimonadales bacterium]